MVGVTLTLYRRNHPLQPSKTQTLVVHYAGAGNAAGNLTPATAGDALLGDARELAGQQRHMQLAQHVVSIFVQSYIHFVHFVVGLYVWKSYMYIIC